MVRFFSLVKFVVLALVIVSAKIPSVIAFDIDIKGLAVQEKLRVPVYYAATSGLPPSSMEDYINNPMPFKMEARYIVDRFSARRNNQLWLNAILTSNSRDKLRTFENSLLQFSRLIKNDMFKGDRLVFDLNPVHGTSVSINNIELGTIPNLDFQTALVSIWFGEKQPSKKFAEQIRQAPSSKDSRAFLALEIQSSRASQLKALQSRLSNNSDSKVIAAAPESNTAARSNKVAQMETKKQSSTQGKATTSSRAVTPRKQQTKPVKVAKSAPSKPKDSGAKSGTKSGTKKETKSSVVKSTAKEQSSKLAKVSPRQTVKKPLSDKTSENLLAGKKQSSTSSKVAKVEPPVSVVDQMFAMLKQDYQAELKQYIEQNAKPAPPIRVRKKPKGQATLRLSLVNEDNKLVVIDSTLLKGEFDGPLLDALHKSVKRLKSMPPIPEAIADQSMNIEVTLDFSRCKRSTSAWICF